MAYVLKVVESKFVMPSSAVRRVSMADVLTAAGVATVSIGALVPSDEPGARATDPLGAELLVVLALPLLVRRWRPVWVMAAVGASAVVVFVLGSSRFGSPSA